MSTINERDGPPGEGGREERAVFVAMINLLKSKTRLMECKIRDLLQDIQQVNELIEGEDLPESILDMIADLDQNLDSSSYCVGALKMLLMMDGLK
jgi:hypothetical protein